MNLYSATHLLQDLKFNTRITISFYIEILLAKLFSRSKILQ